MSETGILFLALEGVFSWNKGVNIGSIPNSALCL